MGRKLASMEVLDKVFWTPFATARRFLPCMWSGFSRTRGRECEEEEGGFGDLADSSSCGSPYTALL